jgi:hypothetical protein
MVTNDEIKISKARKRFGPRILTTTDDAICVDA